MYSVNKNVRTVQVGKHSFEITRRRWVGFGSALTIALVLFLMLAIAPAFALGAMRPGFDTNALGANDDGSTGLVPIGFQVDYLGTTYDNLYVNNNGNVTFDATLSTYTPFNLSSTSRVIIAPFFADVDTRTGNLVRYGSGTVNGYNAFGVTWPGVYCYNTNAGAGQDYFQMILIDRSDTGAGNFDIEFNYDQIDWETGQASSGNSLCEGGSAARVGFSNGSTFNYELPGSAISGSFLDTNQVTGLIHNLLNSSTLGRYVWGVRGSVIIVNQPPTVTLSGANSADEGDTVSYSFTTSDPDAADTFVLVSQSCSTNGTLSNASFSIITGAGGFDCTFIDGPASSDVTVQVEDSDGNLSNIDSITVSVANVAPTATFNAPMDVDEGSDINLSLTDASDPSSADTTAVFEYAFDCGDGASYGAFSSTSSAACSTDDDDLRTVKGQILDKDGGVTEYTASVTVNNVAPTVSIDDISPLLIAAGESVSAEGSFTDPGTGDLHTAVWDWDLTNAGTDTTAGGSVSGLDVGPDSHPYASPGVYTVKLTVTDDDSGEDSDTYELFVVVYDPDGGFVTGGGWIDSPSGAYTPEDPNDDDITGKANFGFVSKYRRGATVPTGNTNFQFKAGDLHFQSTSYEWLVVAGKDKAKYKGDGTINGGGNYGFMLTAQDNGNSGDTFRIKIWDKVDINNDNDDVVVYDNQGGNDDSYDGTALGGGNIKIHTR